MKHITSAYVPVLMSGGILLRVKMRQKYIVKMSTNNAGGITAWPASDSKLLAAARGNLAIDGKSKVTPQLWELVFMCLPRRQLKLRCSN